MQQQVSDRDSSPFMTLLGPVFPSTEGKEGKREQRGLSLADATIPQIRGSAGSPTRPWGPLTGNPHVQDSSTVLPRLGVKPVLRAVTDEGHGELPCFHAPRASSPMMSR